MSDSERTNVSIRMRGVSMQQGTPVGSVTRAPISNYDADGYDYRHYWNGREYEQWAETRVIRKRLAKEFVLEGSAPWLVDLGAGFGRHLPHYRPFAQRIVLVDLSWTNLQAVEGWLARNPALAQNVYLVRANLYHLPFRDAAFDTGLTVRVLHHMTELHASLSEMGRVIQRRWLLDIPSKAHLRSRLRGFVHGQWRLDTDREPLELGDAKDPYRSYHMSAVRDELHTLGWTSRRARAWPIFAAGKAGALPRCVVSHGPQSTLWKRWDKFWDAPGGARASGSG